MKRLLATATLVTTAVLAPACDTTEPNESVTSSSPLVDTSINSDYAHGTGLRPGIVSGRIYPDLSENLGNRMSDFHQLGVKMLRVEIEGSDYAQYRRIVQAARRYGIEVLALVPGTSLGDPKAGDFSSFQSSYIPAYISLVERVLSAIPELKFVEVFNEPDVYEFRPLSGENAQRYALLMVRVYEYFHERDASRPQLVGFDFSRHDDDVLRTSIYNQPSITNHRRWRATKGLPDGLPVDIVSIHGYGNDGVAADQAGYTYQGGTFGDAVNAFLGTRFAEVINDNDRVVNRTPVWYTEMGWGAGRFGEAKQSQLVEYAFATLAGHPEITAAFWYDYRDDASGGGGVRETNGLRAGDPVYVDTVCGTMPSYQKHASWDGFQRAARGNSQPTFSDAPFGYWAHDAIEALYARGITTGFAADQFGPEDGLTKTQIDVFMARARGETTGSPGPSDRATRLDMARALAANGVPRREDYAGYFIDIGRDHPLVREIEGQYDAGVSKGFDAGTDPVTGKPRREFRPDSFLTRAEASTFICRAFKIR